MSKVIKAIFIDSEGTLKNSNNQITNETKEIIEKLKKKGVYVIITTGLPRMVAKRISDNVKASPLIISSNGADIYNLEKETSINASYIDEKVLEEIVENIKDTSIILGNGEVEYCNGFNNYCKDGISFSTFDNLPSKKFFQCHLSKNNERNKNSFLEKYNYYQERLSLIIGIDKLEKFEKNLFFNDKERKEINRLINLLELNDLKDELIRIYARDIQIGNQCADFTTYKSFGEIPWFSLNKIGVSKGFGIKKICEYLEIDLENTMAIGNDYNDLSMWEVVNKFATPIDGMNFIKNKSDFLYDRNNDGISKLLKKVYDERI